MCKLDRIKNVHRLSTNYYSHNELTTNSVIVFSNILMNSSTCIYIVKDIK